MRKKLKSLGMDKCTKMRDINRQFFLNFFRNGVNTDDTMEELLKTKKINGKGVAFVSSDNTNEGQLIRIEYE